VARIARLMPPVVVPALLTRDRRGMGGTASFVRGLEAALRARGIPVILLGVGPAPAGGVPDPHFRSVAARETARGRDLLRGRWARRHRWDFPAGAVLHLQRPDHALAFPGGRWPTVVTFHGRHLRTVARRGGPPAAAIYRWIEGRAGARADAITFVARADLEALLDAHPDWRGRAHHLPVGIDRARFAPGDAKAARRALGLPLEASAAVYVGRLEPEKNVLALIRAIERAAPAELWIAGVGREEARLRAAAGPGVRFLGALDPARLPELMRAGNLVALASRHEGLPTVVLEAWACGRPVVAPPVGDLPALLCSGGGVLAADAQPESLAEAMGALLERAMPEPPEALRARTEPYGWETVGARYAEVYERAVRAWAERGGRAR
jgi:glycosyltransferase involved in cell wall biosynthesis